MNKISNTIHNFLNSSLRYIIIVYFLIMSSLNILFTADIVQKHEEKVTISFYVLQGLGLLLCILLVFILIRIFRDELSKIKFDEKRIFKICTFLYIIASIYIILNIDSNIRADAGVVYNIASNYNHGHSEFNKGGYIYRYPHQLGLLTYDRIISLFSPSTKALFTANTCFVIGTNYTLYKISDFLFKNRTVNILTILFTFAFIPHLLFITFAYGLIPSLFLIVSAFYCALKFCKSNKIKHLLLTLLFCSLAVIIKSNSLIAVIAIAIYLILNLLKNNKTILIVAIISVLLCTVLPTKILNACYEKDTNIKLDNPAPSILWVAMGTDLDNTMRAPGWYDSYIYGTYSNSADRNEAAQKGMQKFKENLSKMKNDRSKALKFFSDKTISQWCEPLYQSDWSGPLPDCNQEIKTPLLQNFYSGGSVNKLVTTYCKTLTLAVWLFSTIFVLFYAKKKNGWQMFFAFSLGGALFHLVWEGKSQYILPYVIILIPFAMYALYRLIKTEKFSSENLFST